MGRTVRKRSEEEKEKNNREDSASPRKATMRSNVNKTARKPAKRRQGETNSPRKLSKHARKSKDFGNASKIGEVQGMGRMGRMQSSQSASVQEGQVQAAFQEEDNFIEMRVDSSEFPSENEEENKDAFSSDEEDAEVSFMQRDADTEISGAEEDEVETIVEIPEDNEARPRFDCQESTKEVGTDQEREERIVNKTVAQIQEFMTTSSFFGGGKTAQAASCNFNTNASFPKRVNFNLLSEKQQSKDIAGKNLSVAGSSSDSMIYQTAVQPAQATQLNEIVPETETLSRRTSGNVSSSEEDQANTSDETVNQEQIIGLINSLHYNFTDKQTTEGDKRRHGNAREDNEPKASTSRGYDHRRLTPPAPSIEQRVDRLIRSAENGRPSINDIPGNVTQGLEQGYFDLSNRFMHSAMVDEDYLVVARHVDEHLVRKIKAGEYIDFARLLPRDRVAAEQDQRMQLVNSNGHLTCMPLGTEGNNIGSFAKWEQAFRVFSNVYMQEFSKQGLGADSV